MTNIPKKLDINEVLKYERAGETSVFVSRINQIIDYLQAKEEASNYKVVSFDPVGETIPEASNGECRHTDTSIEQCDECGKKRNPPEHEESWEKEIRDENWDTPQGIMTKQTILRRGERIGNSTTMLKVEMIVDYIRDNFVSKDKVKQEINHLWFSGACFMQTDPGGRKIFSEQIDKSKKSLGLGD